MGCTSPAGKQPRPQPRVRNTSPSPALRPFRPALLAGCSTRDGSLGATSLIQSQCQGGARVVCSLQMAQGQELLLWLRWLAQLGLALLLPWCPQWLGSVVRGGQGTAAR